MLGRCTASQMAAASAASFLPRLPLMRYGVTSLGVISLTVWPCMANNRAQWCAPEQASLAMVHGGNNATSSLSLARATFGRCSSGLPASFTPCSANTFLARSIPTIEIDMHLPLFEHLDERVLPPIWALRAGLPTTCRKVARDGEVPFIRYGLHDRQVPRRTLFIEG